MSDQHDQQPTRAHALMMAALDDELSSLEQAEFDALLAADEDLRGEWKRLRAVKEVTDTMTFREPPDEVWDTYWVSVYNRAERGFAWLLLSLGSIAVFTWGGWELARQLITDTHVPVWIKVALFGAVLGGSILFVSVIRERWFSRKNDAYREVQR